VEEAGQTLHRLTLAVILKYNDSTTGQERKVDSNRRKNSKEMQRSYKYYLEVHRHLADIGFFFVPDTRVPI
jgi:hypothetical protein